MNGTFPALVKPDVKVCVSDLRDSLDSQSRSCHAKVITHGFSISPLLSAEMYNIFLQIHVKYILFLAYIFDLDLF